MAGKQGQRRFGYVRKLQSARYSASYRDPNGIRRFAPDTFASKPEAVDWLIVQESLMVRREWTDPDRGKVPVGPYATAWIAEQSGTASAHRVPVPMDAGQALGAVLRPGVSV